jgi:hypothetical protein
MVRAEQLHFAWAGPSEPPDLDQIVIDPETTAVTIALMARALIAVVRAVAEADDER